MKRFILKVVAFGTLQLVVLTILWMGWRNEGHYLRGVVLKESLVHQIPSPRVLFVGGSNVAFGVRSEFLEYEFQRPVINLGLHAGFGKDFIINQAASAVQQGDIVVLMLEYEHFSGNYASLDLLTMACIAPSELKFFSLRDWAYLGDRGLSFIAALANAGVIGWGTPRNGSGGAMDLKSFNARADFVHEGTSKFHSSENDQPPLAFPGLDEIVDQLNRLNDVCEAKGAKLYLGFPPMPHDVISNGDDRLAKLDQTLREKLHFEVLWHPADLAQDDSSFFDTRYHLTTAGAEENSRRILESMRGRVPSGESERFLRMANEADSTQMK